MIELLLLGPDGRIEHRYRTLDRYWGAIWWGGHRYVAQHKADHPEQYRRAT